jgi:hypothetical protein
MRRFVFNWGCDYQVQAEDVPLVVIGSYIVLFILEQIILSTHVSQCDEEFKASGGNKLAIAAHEVNFVCVSSE